MRPVRRRVWRSKQISCRKCGLATSDGSVSIDIDVGDGLDVRCYWLFSHYSYVASLVCAVGCNVFKLSLVASANVVLAIYWIVLRWRFQLTILVVTVLFSSFSLVAVSSGCLFLFAATVFFVQVFIRSDYLISLVLSPKFFLKRSNCSYFCFSSLLL